ncbi:MAG: TonB family protein [Gammaproteobacteria bacterium]
MTYVERLPNFQLPTAGFSGRTLILMVVAGLHVLLIGLIVEILRTTDIVTTPVPRPVVLLPDTRKTPPLKEPLSSLKPMVEPFVLKPLIPELDVNRADTEELPRLDPDPRVTGAGSGTEENADVRIQPRQDPRSPIGRPDYPPLSVRLEEAGIVVVNLCVDATGRATTVNLHTSSGYQRLDQAALTHLRKKSIRLLPGTENGQPVPMCTDMRVRFGFDD